MHKDSLSQHLDKQENIFKRQTLKKMEVRKILVKSFQCFNQKARLQNCSLALICGIIKETNSSTQLL